MDPPVTLAATVNAATRESGALDKPGTIIGVAVQRRVFRNGPRARIKDLLPGKASDCGMTAKDNRLFLKAGYTVDISPSLANNSEHWS